MSVSYTPCSNGSFCPNGTAQPRRCTAGFYCPEAKIQVPCPVGFYCPQGTERKLHCPRGHYCPNGDSCNVTQAGTVVPKICPAGLYISLFSLLRGHGWLFKEHSSDESPSLDFKSALKAGRLPQRYPVGWGMESARFWTSLSSQNLCLVSLPPFGCAEHKYVGPPGTIKLASS